MIAYGEGLWPSLAPTWGTLAADEPSVFLSCEWVCAWIAAFGHARRPHGVVWRDSDDQPVACVLLSRGPGKVGPVPVRRAFLNASGSGVGCEHNDVLARPEHRQAVLEDLIGLVGEEGVDELALVGVREELFQELWARWPEPAQEGHLSESPYVNLDEVRASGQPYLSLLSSNTRSQIRRAIRLYEDRFGEPEVRAATSVDELCVWFEAMVSLHTERWSALGETGAFGDASVRAFHLSLLERVLQGRAHELRPEVVRVSFGAESIAYLYELRYRGRVSFYQSGLAYHDDNRLKPGLVAHALAVEHYLAAGEQEYDFLGGEPEAVRYKRSLATNRRMLAWIELPSPTARMRILRGVRLARRGVRSFLKLA